VGVRSRKKNENLTFSSTDLTITERPSIFTQGE
jgi:hypothetical protein